MIKPDNPIKNQTEADLFLTKTTLQALRMWFSIALMMFVTYGFTRGIFFGENNVGLGLSAASGIVVIFAGFSIGIGRLAQGIIYFSAGYLIWFLLNLLAWLFGNQQLGYFLYNSLNADRGLLIFCLIAGLLFRLVITICLYLDKSGRL